MASEVNSHFLNVIAGPEVIFRWGPGFKAFFKIGAPAEAKDPAPQASTIISSFEGLVCKIVFGSDKAGVPHVHVCKAQQWKEGEEDNSFGHAIH